MTLDAMKGSAVLWCILLLCACERLSPVYTGKWERLTDLLTDCVVSKDC